MRLPADKSRRARQALQELQRIVATYGAGVALRKRALLRALLPMKFNSARDLTALQRVVCFLRAFPDDAAVLRAARALGADFSARVARLPRAERMRLDDSGMAGTTTRNAYSAAVAQWLARRFPRTTEIDWKAFEATDALGLALVPLLHPMEDAVTDFGRRGFAAWLRQAKGEQFKGKKASRMGGATPARSDLAWLLQQMPAAGTEAEAFTRAFEAAEVPIVWRIEEGAAAATRNALPASMRPIVARADGMRRPAADPRAAILEPLATIELLAPRRAQRLLDVWRAALLARTRTVYQIEQANLRECYLADFGAGLQMAAIGVAPARRELLEVNYGYLLLANGMPIGYGGFTTLFSQVNTGINVFPEYRGSEAAFAFEHSLRAMRTLTGCERFIINPYQFGAGNDEALASGAYWFYHRLGFRSADAAAGRLAEREFGQRAERAYRVPIATLRRLAAGDLHLDLTAEAGARFFEEAWLDAIAANITATIARAAAVPSPTASRRIAARRLTQQVAAALEIDLAELAPLERRGLAQYAPILAQIADLETWPRADRTALAALCRARWAVNEREFIGRLRAHERLRAALTAVGRAG